MIIVCVLKGRGTRVNVWYLMCKKIKHVKLCKDIWWGEK